MVDWRPAPSVRRGLDEATERWPARSRASDGIIGDAAHSSRLSDHNPDSRGVVHAFDLTHDPAHGVDCDVLAEHLRRVRDRRVRYVIRSRRIFRGPWSDVVLAGRARPWVWEPYTGVNPHTKHLHVSVGYADAPENDVSPWWDVEDAMTAEQEARIVAAIESLRTGAPGKPHSLRAIQQAVIVAGTGTSRFDEVDAALERLAARPTLTATQLAEVKVAITAAVTQVLGDPAAAAAIAGSVTARLASAATAAAGALTQGVSE